VTAACLGEKPRWLSLPDHAPCKRDTSRHVTPGARLGAVKSGWRPGLRPLPFTARISPFGSPGLPPRRRFSPFGRVCVGSVCHQIDRKHRVSMQSIRQGMDCPSFFSEASQEDCAGRPGPAQPRLPGLQPPRDQPHRGLRTRPPGRRPGVLPRHGGGLHAGDLSRSHVIALLQVMEGDTERGWVARARGSRKSKCLVSAPRFGSDLVRTISNAMLPPPAGRFGKRWGRIRAGSARSVLLERIFLVAISGGLPSPPILLSPRLPGRCHTPFARPGYAVPARRLPSLPCRRAASVFHNRVPARAQRGPRGTRSPVLSSRRIHAPSPKRYGASATTHRNPRPLNSTTGTLQVR